MNVLNPGSFQFVYKLYSLEFVLPRVNNLAISSYVLMYSIFLFIDINTTEFNFLYGLIFHKQETDLNYELN